MSGSPNWPLQEAIYARLSGDATLTGTLAAEVYDDVPQGASYPYVVIGGFTGDPSDTMGRTGRDTTFEVHTFSRYAGKKEAEAVLSRVDELLDRWEPTVAGWTSVQIQHDYGPDVRVDPSTKSGTNTTRHGVSRYRIHLHQ